MAWQSKLAAASILVFTVAAGTVVTAQQPQRGAGPPPPLGTGGGGGDDTRPKATSQTWTGAISDDIRSCRLTVTTSPEGNVTQFNAEDLNGTGAPKATGGLIGGVCARRL